MFLILILILIWSSYGDGHSDMFVCLYIGWWVSFASMQTASKLCSCNAWVQSSVEHIHPGVCHYVESSPFSHRGPETQPLVAAHQR